MPSEVSPIDMLHCRKSTLHRTLLLTVLETLQRRPDLKTKVAKEAVLAQCSAIVADALGLTDASAGFQFKIDAKKVTKLEKFA